MEPPNTSAHKEQSDTLAPNSQVSRFRHILTLALSGALLSVTSADCSVDGAGSGPKTAAGISRGNASEWLPEYPVSKKLAFIINGDSAEERHIKNVERAIDSLEAKDFKEFYVVADQVINKEGIDLHQFSGSMGGLDQAFAALGQKGVLQKDALAFFYVTGHGSEDNQGACIALGDGCYPKSAFVEKIGILKGADARGIFVMDECSGFSNAIMDSGVQGIAMSETREGFAAVCDSFARPMFDNLKAGYDSNGDGVAEPIEAYHRAMAEYNSVTGRGDLGEYRESRSELTLGNFENHNKKTLVVEVSATWCEVCKKYSQTIDDVNAIVGEQINVINLTTDTNPEAQELLKKIGLAEPEALPVTVILTPDGKHWTFTGQLPQDMLMDQLRSFGVKPNLSTYENVLVNQSGKSKAVVQRFMQAGIFSSALLMLGDDPVEATEAAMKVAPWLILRNISRLKQTIPDFENVLAEAIKQCVEKSPTRVLMEARSFLDHPLSKWAILEAAKKDPEEALGFASEYEAHPQYPEILEAIGLLAIGQNPAILKDKTYLALFERNNIILNPFKTQNHAEVFLKSSCYRVFERQLIDNLPGLLQQPWGNSVLTEEVSIDSTGCLGRVVLGNISHFERVSDFKTLLRSSLKAQKLRPEYFFRYLHLEKGWSKWPFVEEMGNEHPWIAALCLGDKYKKQRWASDLVTGATKQTVVQQIGLLYNDQFGGVAFDLFDYYKSEPWAMEEVKKMAYKYPKSVGYFDTRLSIIIDEPWAEQFVRDFEDENWELEALEKKPEWLKKFLEEKTDREVKRREEVIKK